MKSRQFHPAAEIFPMVSDEELNELAADIKANKLQQPIELLDKKIIDGRNRYLACQIAGVMPRVCHVKTKDPVAYVLSKNLHRRHLTTSQKAMVAARARELFDEQAKARMAAGGGDKRSPTTPGPGMDICPSPVALTADEQQALMQSEGGVEPEERQPAETLPANCPSPVASPQGTARDQAGQALGVSGKSVDRARKVLRKGTKKLIKAVETGEVTVAAAVKQIDKEDPAPADVLVDEDGVAIPKALRPIFAVQGNFESFANKVSRLKGELESAVEANPDAWSALDPQKAVAELASLRQDFLEGQPYLICPVCGGSDPDKRCKQCNGRGWLSRHLARTTVIELRNPQRQKAGLDLLTKTSQRSGEVTR